MAVGMCRIKDGNWLTQLSLGQALPPQPPSLHPRKSLSNPEFRLTTIAKINQIFSWNLANFILKISRILKLKIDFAI